MSQSPINCPWCGGAAAVETHVFTNCGEAVSVPLPSRAVAAAPQIVFRTVREKLPVTAQRAA